MRGEIVEIVAESIMDRSTTEVTEIKPDDKSNISQPSIQMNNTFAFTIIGPVMIVISITL